MVFVGAEHDCLLHPVGAFKILRYLLGHLVCAVLDDDVVVEVAVGVDAVFNELSVLVELTLERAPSVGDVGPHVYDLERREKAVLDSLAQAVCVYGLAEVVDV